MTGSPERGRNEGCRPCGRHNDAVPGGERQAHAKAGGATSRAAAWCMLSTAYFISICIAALGPFAPVASADVTACKAKVNPKTGLIEVSAKTVQAFPRWGVSPTAVNRSFADESTCFASAKLVNCHIGDPADDSGSTPPPNCKIYVRDETIAPPCVAFIRRGCTVLTAVPGTMDHFLDVNSGRRVFVTKFPTFANLGSLEIYDSICQSSASVDSLGGTWVAWLSTGTTFAVNRLTPETGPYRRLDGVKVADSIADLTNGTLDAPINVDETGAVHPPGLVLTGTSDDGFTYGFDCLGWTSSSSSDSVAVGSLEATSGWSANDTLLPCDQANGSLYCFER